MTKINIGIIGYGNLGKGVEKCINLYEDFNLVGIFTQRNPKTINSINKVYSFTDLIKFKEKIDICIICSGSASSLINQSTEIIKNFSTVDCYDTHANIPNYYEKMNELSLKYNQVSLISTGWDPGLFSLNRVLLDSIIPKGELYTFWGKGVSQGHSDAIKKIPGVLKAIQYTIPNDEALNKLKEGQKLELSTRDKHIRECFVVIDENYDKNKIENSIKTMENYFDEYDTYVHFINEETFNKEHVGMPHGGKVLKIGETIKNKQIAEFNLKLDNNPEFTASVSIACARAVYKLKILKDFGCKTILDIPIKYLSDKEDFYLINKYL